MRARGATAAAAALVLAVAVLVAVAAAAGPALQVTTGPVPDFGTRATVATPTPVPTSTEAGPPVGRRSPDAPAPELGLLLLLSLAALAAAVVTAVLVARRSRAGAVRTAAEQDARPAPTADVEAGGALPSVGAAVRAARRWDVVVDGERAALVRLWTDLVAASGAAREVTGSPRAQERALASGVRTPEARAAVAELRGLYEEAAFSGTDPPPGRWQRALDRADVVAAERAAAGGAVAQVRRAERRPDGGDDPAASVGRGTAAP